MAAETGTPGETATDTSAQVTTDLYTPDTIISPYTCRPYTELNKELAQTRSETRIFWCEPCQIQLTNVRIVLTHFRGKGHRKQTQNTSTPTAIGVKRKVGGENGSSNGVDSGVKRLRTDGTTNDPAAIPEDLLKCEVCERGFTNASSALAHFKSKKHNSKVESVYQLNLAKQVTCEKCNVEFKSIHQAFAHYKGKKHIQVTAADLAAPSVNSAPEGKQENGVAKQLADVPADTPLKCDICSITFTSQPVAHSHFKGKRHRGKLKHLSISNGNDGKQSD